jgi:ferredoxin
VKRIVIDEERCTGNGRCYSLFPHLFSDDESGHGQAVGDGAIGEDQLENAVRAVRACPEQAITLVDR